MRWREGLISAALLGAASAQGCGVFLGAIAPIVQPDIVLANFKAPKTAKRGQPVTVRLFATVSDGCGEFPGAGARVDETSKVVTFWGFTDRGNVFGMCSMSFECLERQVAFTPANVGTYQLKARLAPTRIGSCGGWEGMEPAISDTDVFRDSEREYDVTFKMEVTE